MPEAIIISIQKAFEGVSKDMRYLNNQIRGNNTCMLFGIGCGLMLWWVHDKEIEKLRKQLRELQETMAEKEKAA